MLEIMRQSLEVGSASLHSALQVTKIIVVPCFLDEHRHYLLEVLFAIGELLLQDECELLVLFLLENPSQPLLLYPFGLAGQSRESSSEGLSLGDVGLGDELGQA